MIEFQFLDKLKNANLLHFEKSFFTKSKNENATSLQFEFQTNYKMQTYCILKNYFSQKVKNAI